MQLAVSRPLVLSGRALLLVRLELAVVLGFAALWCAQELTFAMEWARHNTPDDFVAISAVDPRDPYASDWYRWAIPAAWLWSAFIAPLGSALWQLLHLAALVLLPARIALIALVAFPFWMDLADGNLLTFVFVAAWWALEGRRAAVVAYCVLAVLIPRPIMLPLLAWLLWHRADARWAFGLAAAVVIGITVAQGQLGTWLSHLLIATGNEMAAPYNYSPSQWIGAAWLFVAWPLAALAFVRGHIGWASVLAAPYVIHYYWLMALLELRRWPWLRGAPEFHGEQLGEVGSRTPVLRRHEHVHALLAGRGH